MIKAAFFSISKNSLPMQSEREVCIANISLAERQKRIRFGIQQLIVTLIVLTALIVLHANPLWRLSLLFMFWSAAVGFFQARDKT